MNLSVKMRTALLFAVVFLSTFFATMFIITITQSAYSTPDEYDTTVENMVIKIGPKPNSTDVPLDTTITIDALSSAALDELQTTPEVSISSIATEVSGPLSYKQTFYPAQLLKPATSYSVSTTIKDTPFSWSFTTTLESYQPKTSYYIATYAPWIALAAAIITTLFAVSAIWTRKKLASHQHDFSGS